MTKTKIFLFFILISFFIAFFYFNLLQYLNLEFIQSQKSIFSNWYENHPFLFVTLFFVAYVLITGFSAPGASILTLMAGYLFGLVVGTLITSFASTFGATMAFLMSRFILKDFVHKKFGSKLIAVNKGFEKDGNFYLFTLRLIPIFPFFIVNLVMGLTPIKTLPYFVISQVGMLPGTIVYVNAGTQLSKVNSFEDILSPVILLSFLVLALLPWIVKTVMKFFSFKKRVVK